MEPQAVKRWIQELASTGVALTSRQRCIAWPRRIGWHWHLASAELLCPDVQIATARSMIWAVSTPGGSVPYTSPLSRASRAAQKASATTAGE